jgi:hypothetical protein
VAVLHVLGIEWNVIGRRPTWNNQCRRALVLEAVQGVRYGNVSIQHKYWEHDGHSNFRDFLHHIWNVMAYNSLHIMHFNVFGCGSVRKFWTGEARGVL